MDETLVSFTITCFQLISTRESLHTLLIFQKDGSNKRTVSS